MLVMREDSKALAAVTRLLGRKIDEVSLTGSTEIPAAVDEAGVTDTRDGKSRERRPRRQPAETTRQVLKQATPPTGDTSQGACSNNSKVEPLPTAGRPGKPFGDHTPAFMLRRVKLAASA